MGLMVISGAGTTIGGVPRQNMIIVGVLCAIGVIDFIVFTSLMRPDRDVRERKLMDRWAARSVMSISVNPAFSALRLSGVERQEMSRLVMQDSIDRAPEGLL